MIGETILHYKIIEKLGEGGMGEVYKARDTKLDRFAALKFLPSQLTASEDDKLRFMHEAKAASAMNHPNVCTIHSIEEYNNQLFIVMEFVDGKTLKDKKDSLSEKQILEIGIQAAEGLAAAHEKGIVHRDIKPENIMIRKDGIVQIMDFGLAKLYTSGNVSRLTKPGTTMGTMGYMSPEQIQGLDVDHRTDIFSLGIVLYELLAGEPPFKGMHETAILYEIVNVDPPPISSIKESFSPELDTIILECLEKDKDERCQSAKELAKDLRKVKKSTGNRKSRIYNTAPMSVSGKTGASQVSIPSSESITTQTLNKRFKLKKLIPAALIIAIISSLIFAYLYFNQQEIIDTGIIQFDISPPPGTKFNPETPVISPNGRTIAFTAADSTGKSMIWLRQLESTNAVPLAGTENAGYPFWSYDNKFLCFYSNEKLNKIDVATGLVQELCDASGREGSWGSSDIILFTRSLFSTIYKMKTGGGTAAQATTLNQSLAEEGDYWPQFLPDNKHFLYSAFSRNEINSGLYVGSIEDTARTLIMKIEQADPFLFKARFVSPDYLFILKNKDLTIQKFDPYNLKILSDSKTFLSDNSDYSISNNVLVLSQNSSKASSDLLLLDRQGKQIESKPDLGFFIEISESPDENSTAYHRIYGPDNSQTFNQDIWIYNKNRGLTSRFTYESAADIKPLWSPDGKSMVYASSPDAVYDIYEKEIGSNSTPKLLLKTEFNKYPDDWSLDGKYILYETQDDLWVLPMTGDRKPIKYLNTPFTEWSGSFSPDAKWIAYTSNESGRDEVYIQSFPELKQRYQVTTNGGNGPKWRKDGKELFYCTSDQKLMAVSIETNPKFTIGIPKELFKADLWVYSNRYAVLDNGQHFLINKISTSSFSKPLKVIVNWKSLLNQK